MQHVEEQPVLDRTALMSWAPRSDARRSPRSVARVSPSNGFAWRKARLPIPKGDAAGSFGMEEEVIRVQATFPVRSVGDALVARQYGRSFAQQKGFSCGDEIVIDAVLSELATNVLSFAGKGEIVFGTAITEGRTGIVIVVRDQGPGISDVSGALTDGYSTVGRPGLGLAGVRRLMDSFNVVSAAGEGTTITMKKWLESAG